MATILSCFNDTTLSIDEIKEVTSYNMLSDTFFNLHDRICDAAMFGADYECDARLSLDLSMLILFFRLIYKERIEDYILTGECRGTEYSEKYCLEKVKDSFFCRGIDPDQLELLFSYWEMNLLTEDGIGHMAIESVNECIPRFRVRWIEISPIGEPIPMEPPVGPG